MFHLLTDYIYIIDKGSIKNASIYHVLSGTFVRSVIYVFVFRKISFLSNMSFRRYFRIVLMILCYIVQGEKVFIFSIHAINQINSYRILFYSAYLYTVHL